MTIYNDLDFSLKKTDTNDFNILNTENTIKQSILNLILTRIGFSAKFEKPSLGSGIYDLLSEKPTRFVALQIKDQIESALENYEQRIMIDKISVAYDPTNNNFVVSIQYTIISLDINDSLILNLDVIT